MRRDARPPVADLAPATACEQCPQGFHDPGVAFALQVHRNTQHGAAWSRGRHDNEENIMPGSSDQTFEQAKQAQTDFARKVADARKGGANKS